jgi:hypothetical protein
MSVLQENTNSNINERVVAINKCANSDTPAALHHVMGRGIDRINFFDDIKKILINIHKLLWNLRSLVCSSIGN